MTILPRSELQSTIIFFKNYGSPTRSYGFNYLSHHTPYGSSGSPVSPNSANLAGCRYLSRWISRFPITFHTLPLARNFSLGFVLVYSVLPDQYYGSSYRFPFGIRFERYLFFFPSHSVFYMFLPEGIFVLFKFHIRIFAKSRKSQLQFFCSLETINYSFIFSVHFFKLQNLLFSIRGTFCTFLSFRMFYFTSFSFYILLFYSTKFFFLLHTDLCFSTKTSNSFPFISNLDLFHFYKTLSRSFPSISFYNQCRTFYRIKLHNFLFP